MFQQTIDRPAPLPCGRIPTLNDRGFTTNLADPLSREFVAFAVKSGEEVLDIGCAYGVAVKEVLAGGGRVCASDMEPRHLQVLQAAIAPDWQARLRCVPAKLPHGDFLDDAFAAILCSRVLHFLDGDEVDLALANMRRWLKPGGRLFLVVDSPYSGSTKALVVPIYENNKANNALWPGLIPDFETILPVSSGVKFETSFIHMMDPETLSAACRRAGFSVEKTGYMARIANLSQADPHGRDHAVAVVSKA